jgi:hypothetical protein
MSRLLGTSDRKNLLIGGDFGTNPWQRGATFNIGTSGSNVLTADCWSVFRGSFVDGVTITANWSTALLTNYLKLQRNSGNTTTNAVYLAQCTEILDSINYRGKWATLSFYAFVGSNFSGGTIDTQIVSVTNTTSGEISTWAGSPSGSQYFSKTFTPPTANTWQKFSHTFLVPTDMEHFKVLLGWTPTGTAGAADSLNIALIQLEVGQQASDFEHLSSATVLDQCLRRYEKSDFTPGTLSFVGFEGWKSLVAIPAYQPWDLYRSVSFKKTKRTTPTVTLYSGNGLDINAVTNSTVGYPKTGASAFLIGPEGFSRIRFDTTGSVAISFDDQLAFKWTASADI